MPPGSDEFVSRLVINWKRKTGRNENIELNLECIESADQRTSVEKG